MDSWNLFKEMAGNIQDSLPDPVAEMLEQADFDCDPWRERKALYIELLRRFGEALGKDLPVTMKRLDSLYYRYYMGEFRPKMIEEVRGVFRRLNAYYERQVQVFLGDKEVFMLQGSELLPRLARTAQVCRENLAYFEGLQQKGSLREEIFNLYQNLLVTNRQKILSRIENYVRKKQGLGPREKVDLNRLAELRSGLLLEALEQTATPLHLISDKKTLLWIARFFRNFEECYQLPQRLFSFEDDEFELAVVADKVRKIIERCYIDGGVERNLQKRLERWKIERKGANFRYRS